MHIYCLFFSVHTSNCGLHNFEGGSITVSSWSLTYGYCQVELASVILNVLK